jgi:dihydrofolate reductase
MVRGNLTAEIGKLKDRPGQDLLLSGSGQLLNGLMHANLIDLYRLMVHPIVLTKGGACSPTASTQQSLRWRTTRRSTPASSSSNTSPRPGPASGRITSSGQDGQAGPCPRGEARERLPIILIDIIG